MAIDKINRTVLSRDVTATIDGSASKAELQALRTDLENQINSIVSGQVRKPSVPTYDDIFTTYPSPDEGWTVSVDDTNITYQYDADTSTWIKTSINAIPKATEELDGLMSKEDKAIVDSLPYEVTAESIKTKLLTVDGESSGLDADMLDGKHATYFATATHDHDGRYYNKTEANTLLSGKADIGHTHQTFVHDQVTPLAQWVITHSMGKHPSVTIVDSSGTAVVGDISYDSNNQITLSFSVEFSGKAYLN